MPARPERPALMLMPPGCGGASRDPALSLCPLPSPSACRPPPLPASAVEPTLVFDCYLIGVLFGYLIPHSEGL